MKLFLDTAQIDAIERWATTGLIDGVTTNPTHLSVQGGNPVSVIKEILALLPDGDISVEVTNKEPRALYDQARAIAALGTNVVVKIPCHKDYYFVIHQLVQEKVRLNITLVFSVAQSVMMCKLGVAYISLFVGRLDDAKVDGIAVLADIRSMIDWYGFDTQLLAASLRTVARAQDALLAGADAITVPIAVFEGMIMHPLTDRGIVQFDEDWKKLDVSQFP